MASGVELVSVEGFEKLGQVTPEMAEAIGVMKGPLVEGAELPEVLLLTRVLIEEDFNPKDRPSQFQLAFEDTVSQEARLEALGIEGVPYGEIFTTYDQVSHGNEEAFFAFAAGVGSLIASRRATAAAAADAHAMQYGHGGAYCPREWEPAGTEEQ
jgi:hypothetical protein